MENNITSFVWEIILQFIKLFVPINKLPPEAVYITGLLIAIAFISLILFTVYLPIILITRLI